MREIDKIITKTSNIKITVLSTNVITFFQFKQFLDGTLKDICELKSKFN